MGQIGSVQGHRSGVSPRRQRGPLREPEVGVDDVELSAAVAATQAHGTVDICRRAARREGEQLDLGAASPLQRLHLVADKAAELRAIRSGIHVGHHQCAHCCGQPTHGGWGRACALHPTGP